MRFSCALGVTVNSIMSSGDLFHGPFFHIEPGLAGGKVNLGYRTGRVMFVPVLHGGMSLSLLRTWGEPLSGVESGQTYLGAELSGGFMVVVVNGGLYRHVGGEDSTHDWIVSLGAGLGF